MAVKTVQLDKWSHISKDTRNGPMDFIHLEYHWVQDGEQKAGKSDVFDNVVHCELNAGDFYLIDSQKKTYKRQDGTTGEAWNVVGINSTTPDSAIAAWSPEDDIFGDDVPKKSMPVPNVGTARTTTEDIHFQVAIKEVGEAERTGTTTKVFLGDASMVANAYRTWVVSQLSA